MWERGTIPLTIFGSKAVGSYEVAGGEKNFFFEARGNRGVAEGGALEKPRICQVWKERSWLPR